MVENKKQMTSKAKNLEKKPENTEVVIMDADSSKNTMIEGKNQRLQSRLSLHSN